MNASKTILFKKEAVYGTDAAPTPEANAVPTRNFQATPIEVDTLERNLDLPSRGRTRTANTNRRQTFSYELDLAGSGAAGTAAPFMEHLEACGMAAPVLDATPGSEKAEQKFAGVGALLSSATCHHWMGEQRCRVRGVRGNFSIDFTAGRYPFAALNHIGLLPAKPAPAVDTIAPVGTPDFDRWIEPVEVHTDNTEFTFHGFALTLQSLRLDTNAELAIRNLVGANYVNRGNHAMTGRIVAEAPLMADKDFYAALDDEVEGPLQLIHGTVAGNIIQLDAANVQILSIARTEEADRIMFEMAVGLNIDVGQDDLLITAK